jgi:hypothetical protein
LPAQQSRSGVCGGAWLVQNDLDPVKANDAPDPDSW